MADKAEKNVYRLLAGVHQCKDLTKPIKDENGKPTGRYETRYYSAGELVESTTDLVAKHGPEKFRLVRAAKKQQPMKAVSPQNEAPHGQAQSGFQVNSPTAPNEVDGSRVEYSVESPEEAVEAAAGEPVTAKVLTPSKATAGKDEADEDEDYDDEEDMGGDSDLEPEEEEPVNFYKMTVKELQDYADQHNVDLGNTTRKDDMVKALKKSQGQK